MMISPESYYEEYLKGKNEKQIMTATRGLKQEMGRLKNIMKSPDYGSEATVRPSERARLWHTRMYLDRAKRALADAGGTYTPSKAELKAESFDASIPDICRVIFLTGGYFDGYETRTITVDEGHIRLELEHSLGLKPSDPSDGPDYPCGKERLLEGIRELHIGEWRTSYSDPDILDGTQWELTIEFSNGHKPFRTGGSNAYPYNFDDLLELLGVNRDNGNGEELDR